MPRHCPLSSLISVPLRLACQVAEDAATNPVAANAQHESRSAGSTVPAACREIFQDLRFSRALSILQPQPNRLFPGISFVARLLLIAGKLHQICCVKPLD